MQKKLVEAEGYLKRALQEAKAGFGEDDPHVAGACNNLAELHRLKKEFPEAEALYQQVQRPLNHCGVYKAVYSPVYAFTIFGPVHHLYPSA